MEKSFNRTATQILGFIVLTAVLAACGGGKQNPVETAKGFWTNLLSQDPSLARNYVADKEREVLTFNDWNENDKHFLGKPKKENGFISIDTILILERRGKKYKLPLKTVLVEKNGDWLVDYAATRATLFDAVIENLLNSMADKLVVGTEVLGSEIPEFTKQEDRQLHNEIQSYMSETGTFIFDAITDARKNAIQKKRGIENNARALRQTPQ